MFLKTGRLSQKIKKNKNFNKFYFYDAVLCHIFVATRAFSAEITTTKPNRYHIIVFFFFSFYRLLLIILIIFIISIINIHSIHTFYKITKTTITKMYWRLWKIIYFECIIFVFVVLHSFIHIWWIFFVVDVKIMWKKKKLASKF